MQIQKILTDFDDNNKTDFRMYLEEVNFEYPLITFVNRKTDLKNIFEIAASLIVHNIIFEACVIDYSLGKRYRYYRDYEKEDGDKIMYELEVFDLNPNYKEKGVYLSFKTLEINTEDLHKITQMNSFLEVIEFIKELTPINKPLPKNYNKLIEMINEKHSDFRINGSMIEHVGFIGDEITGTLKGPTREWKLYKLCKNKQIFEIQFFDYENNKWFSLHYNTKKIIKEPVPNNINFNTNPEEVKILVSDLKEENLVDIYKCSNFNEVLKYLESYEPIQYDSDLPF